MNPIYITLERGLFRNWEALCDEPVDIYRQIWMGSSTPIG